MNKIALLISHCVIDEKIFECKSRINRKTTSLGGPVTYYSHFLAATEIIPYIITSFSKKMSSHYLTQLKRLDCKIYYNEPTSRSTKYKLKYNSYGKRELSLITLANKIQINEILPKANFALVSPVYNEITLNLFNLLRLSTKIIVLDPQGFFRKADSTGKIRLHEWYDPEVLSQVNILKLSQNEAEFLKKNSKKQFIEKLFEFNRLNIVIITQGSKGSSIFYRDEKNIRHWKIPAYPISNTVVDETGAGDIYLAALTYWYYKKKDIISSAIKATAISSWHIEQDGLIKTINPEGDKKRITWIEERTEQIK